MKRHTTVAILLGFAAGMVGAGTEAQAQGTGMVPVRVKVGVLRPQDGTTRAATGSTHLGAEVDVALPLPGAGKTMVTAGIAQGSENGIRLRTIPITVTRLFSPPNPVGSITGNVYFGAGAGVYLLRASGGGVSQSKTRPGVFGVVGYQFPNPYFVEAKYHHTGRVAGVSPRGFALMLGRRF